MIHEIHAEGPSALNIYRKLNTFLDQQYRNKKSQTTREKVTGSFSGSYPHVVLRSGHSRRPDDGRFTNSVMELGNRGVVIVPVVVAFKRGTARRRIAAKLACSKTLIMAIPLVQLSPSRHDRIKKSTTEKRPSRHDYHVNTLRNLHQSLTLYL